MYRSVSKLQEQKGIMKYPELKNNGQTRRYKEKRLWLWSQLRDMAIVTVKSSSSNQSKQRKITQAITPPEF